MNARSGWQGEVGAERRLPMVIRSEVGYLAPVLGRSGLGTEVVPLCSAV